MKPILISGTQPTGRLHLGNYLGALKNFVELQNSNKYECYFIVVDYHSLTVDFDPSQKKKEILGVIRAYIAAGIDPKKSYIFIQSHVPESTELAWVLNTITPIGELERMTQFKDKAKRKESINAGLLTYPVLMAADIFLYNTKFVPVGEDQLQHLELARTLARKFNNKFGETFIEPQPLLTKTSRIMSLHDPARKMSKSRPDTCIFLDDPTEEIEKKIKRAITDSESKIKYDPKNKAGISNLLSIYSGLSMKSIPDLEKKYRNKKYGEFKADLAKAVIEVLKPFRTIKVSETKLKSITDAGAKSAKKKAMATMKRVKKKLGLLN